MNTDSSHHCCCYALTHDTCHFTASREIVYSHNTIPILPLKQTALKSSAMHALQTASYMTSTIFITTTLGKPVKRGQTAVAHAQTLPPSLPLILAITPLATCTL